MALVPEVLGLVPIDFASDQVAGCVAQCEDKEVNSQVLAQILDAGLDNSLEADSYPEVGSLVDIPVCHHSLGVEGLVVLALGQQVEGLQIEIEHTPDLLLDCRHCVRK